MEAGFKNVTMPEDREATFQMVRQIVISGQKSLSLETRSIHSSGHIVVGMLHLGLAIAHHLMTSLGGQIDYSGTPQKTRFWIDIPKSRV